jgi:RNA polymerase sigma-70 factor (ECF subfamily)
MWALHRESRVISARQSFSSSTTRAAHALPGKVEAASAPKPGAMIGREPELRALLISGMNGNAADYRAFLSLLAGFLRSFYRGKLGRVGRQGVEAEDLVQEALLAIHTRRDTYRTGEPVTPWIYAIARYKLIDYLRRTRSSLSDAPVEDAQHVPAPDGHAASESSLDLERLLEPLSEKMRMAVRLVKIDGLSVDEASRRSGLTVSDIKISVHRGLKAMAAAVAERDKP